MAGKKEKHQKTVNFETQKTEPKVEKKEQPKVEKKSVHNTLAGQETTRQFCLAVSEERYDDAYELTQITWRQKYTQDKILPIKAFGEMMGKGFEVSLKKRISDMCYLMQIKSMNGKFSVKVIKEIEAYKPHPEGYWGINPLSIRKM